MGDFICKKLGEAVCEKVKEYASEYRFLMDFSPSDLNINLVDFVESRCLLFKPLSHRKVRLSSTLVMQAWIRDTYGFKKLGSTLDSFYLFDVLQEYGDTIAEKVRQPIRKDFAEFVRLVKCLRRFDFSVSVNFSPLEVSFVRFLGSEPEVRKVNVDCLHYKTSSPISVYFMLGGKELLPLSIDSANFYMNLDVLGHYFAELVEMARDKYKEISENNAVVRRKIEELVSPWAAAASL